MQDSLPGMILFHLYAIACTELSCIISVWSFTSEIFGVKMATRWHTIHWGIEFCKQRSGVLPHDQQFNIRSSIPMN